MFEYVLSTPLKFIHKPGVKAFLEGNSILPCNCQDSDNDHISPTYIYWRLADHKK